MIMALIFCSATSSRRIVLQRHGITRTSLNRSKFWSHLAKVQSDRKPWKKSKRRLKPCQRSERRLRKRYMTKVIREACLTDYLEFLCYWIEESLAEYKKNPLAYNSYVQELSILNKIVDVD